MNDYIDEMYPDWYRDVPMTAEIMVLDNDVRGIEELIDSVDPPVDYDHLYNIARSDEMKEFILTLIPWPMEEEEVDININTMEHPYGGVHDFEQVYDEDFDFETTVPDIESMEVDEGDEDFIGIRQLYPPTTNEQDMLGMGVEPIFVGSYYYDDIGPTNLSEELDAGEFPERYPGMPGFQPQIEYSLGVGYDEVW